MQRIMMNTKIEHIGVTPAQIIFGNAIDLDRGIFLPHLPKDEEEREMVLSEWAAKMLKAQAVLLELVEKQQRHKDLQHGLANYVFNPTEFPINSYVLWVDDLQPRSIQSLRVHFVLLIVSKMSTPYKIL